MFAERVSRRTFLTQGGLTLGAALASLSPSAGTPQPGPSPGFGRYTDLMTALERRGHKPRVLGHAPDRSPVVAVKAGGDKKPAIFISAGSHSTEHAGVAAAVELINELKTSHQVYVLPCRDPVGLSGYRHALSLSLGCEPGIASIEEAEKLLRAEGEVLHDAGGRLLVLIGEYGYANRGFSGSIQKGDSYLEALRGRRLYWPSNHADVPGSGPLARAYTLVVSPEGAVLHLNRFHDTPWAPAEVRCARRLMAEVQPRLVFDLHEYVGDAFWMSARRQQTEEDERWEARMAGEAARAAAAAGARFPAADYRPGSFFEKLEPGVFWLDAKQRGEGLNLVDFAARRYGPGFTVETGMRQEFGHRVSMHKAVVKAAVKVFEERHA